MPAATPVALLAALILASHGHAAWGQSLAKEESRLPVVVNTWAFTDATAAAWDALTAAKASTPHLDAVVEGCRSCEQSQCDFTVGFGGSPDEDAETSLDALLMDGETMNVGAVGSLRHCKEAIRTARRVLENTAHSLLVGLQASQFALEMAVPLDNLTTDRSHGVWHQWKKHDCQPNYRVDVVPDPQRSCGPYRPANAQPAPVAAAEPPAIAAANHDTISLVAIDKSSRIAAGSSSNGVNHKVPGRVGDASVAGGGAYAEKGVGGCASTGNGDLHLRFLPCYQVVESLRTGASPAKAAEGAVRRILKWYPHYVGAVVAVDAEGRHGAAAAGWEFTYAARDALSGGVQTFKVASLSGAARAA